MEHREVNIEMDLQLKPYLDKVTGECFPSPVRDSVNILLKRMFVNKIVSEAFVAGWKAARGETP